MIFDADKTIQDVIRKADECGLDTDALDEVVCDIATQEASDVNNEGVEAQITCIIASLGPEGKSIIETIMKGDES